MSNETPVRDINTQRIAMIEAAEWITSPNDGVLSKGLWRLHIRKPNGGKTTIYGKTLIETLDSAIAALQPK